jgi:outer membrane protein TolC
VTPVDEIAAVTAVMKRLLFVLFVVGAATSDAAIAAAQHTSAPAGTAPPVEALVERALGRAPSLAARRARVEAAQAALRAAGTLPNPMIEFEYRDYNFPRYTIGSDPMSMAGASLRQDLLSRGRRQAQRQVAQAQIGERRAEQDVLAADLATEVRVQYARLYALDRERATLTDADQLVAMLVATASSRYAAGESDQASVLRAQLERTQIGQRLVDIDTERYSVQTALNRLTNDPPDTAIGVVTELPADAPLPALAAAAGAEPARSPEIVERARGVDVASRRVEAARQELHPAWSVGGGLYWQGGLNRTFVFDVGVELPFRKEQKQRPLIAAAEQEVRAAQLELQDTTAAVRADIARLATEWRAAGEQIDRDRTAVLPQNSAAFDATRSSYLTGRGDFVSVLEEFRRWIEVRIDLASREADRYTARARIEALVGQPPTS